MSEIKNEISEINDIRIASDFKGQTFSGFKKSECTKELFNSFHNNKLESSCYWCAELICSGHYLDIWDTIILFYSKNIHTGNAKLVYYLDKKCEQFKSILNNGYSGEELRLRNNEKIRVLFAELCLVIHFSKKKHSLNEIKIDSGNNVIYKYKAPSLHYLEDFLHEDDLKDIFVPLNEFIYQIIDEKNSVDACYWLEFLMELEKKYKKEKIVVLGTRQLEGIDFKFQKDMCLCVWEILLKISKLNSDLVKKIVKSSFKLFSLKYSNGSFKKRKFLIYFIIEVLCNPINSKEPMITEKERIDSLLQNLDIIYQQIKKNEQSPDTDYLFNEDKNNNLEKTINKLDKMKDFETSFIPRL